MNTTSYFQIVLMNFSVLLRIVTEKCVPFSASHLSFPSVRPFNRK